MNPWTTTMHLWRLFLADCRPLIPCKCTINTAVLLGYGEHNLTLAYTTARRTTRSSVAADDLLIVP